MKVELSKPAEVFADEVTALLDRVRSSLECAAPEAIEAVLYELEAGTLGQPQAPIADDSLARLTRKHMKLRKLLAHTRSNLDLLRRLQPMCADLTCAPFETEEGKQWLR